MDEVLVVENQSGLDFSLPPPETWHFRSWWWLKVSAWKVCTCTQFSVFHFGTGHSGFYCVFFFVLCFLEVGTDSEPIGEVLYPWQQYTREFTGTRISLLWWCFCHFKQHLVTCECDGVLGNEATLVSVRESLETRLHLWVWESARKRGYTCEWEREPGNEATLVSVRESLETRLDLWVWESARKRGYTCECEREPGNEARLVSVRECSETRLHLWVWESAWKRGYTCECEREPGNEATLVSVRESLETRLHLWVWESTWKRG